MRLLVPVFTLVMLLPAAAQQPPPLPTTVNLYNKATKEVIGTVTISGNRLYYRNTKGEHVSTGVVNPDGTHSFFDASGKPIKK